MTMPGMLMPGLGRTKLQRFKRMVEVKGRGTRHHKVSPAGVVALSCATGRKVALHVRVLGDDGGHVHVADS